MMDRDINCVFTQDNTFGDNEGETALHAAAEGGNFETAKAIIEAAPSDMDVMAMYIILIVG